jgi:E-phenylitaconyl-CoA hydratase
VFAEPCNLPELTGTIVSRCDVAEVDYEVRDGIALLTLNRPERMNALTRRNMTVDLPEAWTRFSADDDARVAIITGAGDRAFCSGMDVRESVERESSPGGASSDGAILVSPRANQVEKPVIAAINGVCAGVGVLLAADCDILLASTTASFTDTRTSVGLMAAMGSTELTRVMPVHEVLRLVMMGRSGRLTAERAYSIGFVTELAEPAELLAAARRVALAVLDNAPVAVALTKRAIWEGLDRGLGAAIENAETILHEHPTTDDMREGTRAFIEKRPPQWKLR